MIPKWKLKAIVQKSISVLPNAQYVNTLFQKYVTKGLRLDDEHFGYKLRHAKDHLSYFNEWSDVEIGCAKVLELGTGWYPVIPIYLWLHGANEIHTMDLRKWTSTERLHTTIDKMREKRESIQSKGFDPSRWQMLVDLRNDDSDEERIFEQLGIFPWIGDARHTVYADGEFDFICSNNTFEHVYEDVLRGILVEFKRVLRKDSGVMSHFVDMSDHFAHMDSSITVYNFLQYSKQEWQRIDNNIQPQNRLRLSDYLAMYADLEIPVSKTEKWPYDADLLDKIELHAEYESYERDDLALVHAYLITKNQAF